MSFCIPEKTFDQHILVLGKTRSGKSSVMRLIVEHLLDEEKPVTIIDPKGDWWGLKSSANGKQAGYPVVIFGGEHADMPLNAKSGATVAELAATGNRPCIIDLGGWMPGARTEFYVDFASTFFRLTRGRRWLVIDEVHNFCPQGKVLDPQAGKMLHWSNRLASEGLGKGVSLIAASQRPQKVHKDFVTSAETLVAMRVIHPLDRNAIREWVDGCGDPAKGKAVLDTLALNQRGEGWVWSPEIGFGPKQIQFPLFGTYDSFKAQNAQAPAKLKGWADVNLDDIKTKLESVVKEAEANDPAKLKARIRELEKQRQPAPVKTPNIDEHKHRQEIAEKQKAIDGLEHVLGSIRKVLSRIATDAATVLELPYKPVFDSPVQTKPQSKYQPPSKITTPRTQIETDSVDKLRSGAERMLAALAQWHPGGMAEGQMRSHAGLKKSGTFSAYMSDLRRGGYIEERDGEVFASSSGLEYCKHVPAAPSTTEDVLAIWNPKLRDGARRMLEILVRYGGNPIEKDTLGQEAGLVKSGTFSAYLSDLKTARLVNVGRDGTVAANKETLFL